MNDRYEAFCMASPVYYDTLHSAPQDGQKFAIANREAPEEWSRFEQDDWVVYAPDGLDLPGQGWKIHASATLDNAEAIIEAVWQYCVPRNIEFKFLRSSATLWLRSSKYAPRGYSGKLVTVYPADNEACERILEELGDILAGNDGPYILSDVRWGPGPLYVRDGGYAPRYCVDDNGQVVLGIEDGTGKAVPDRRDPVFYVPPWVTVPDFLAPHIAARGQVTVGELRYTFESVMHFSNGGGLYRGRDRETGVEVVLKEARPLAGLDSQGADAVTRLRREHDTLQRLAGIPGIPKVYDKFTVGDHHFIAMEFVEGGPLRGELVRRYPMINVSATDEDFASYTDWALDIYRQVEVTVHAMHERGVVYGDLHLFNIMVRPDGTVALLDFETASLAADNARPGLGNQGFAPPRGTTGTAVDRYALACLRLALFMPVTQLLWLSRPKAIHLADVIREHFPVPDGYLEKAVDLIAPDQDRPPKLRLSADRGEWPDLRSRLVSAIRTSASPDRDDRLFPGDIEQFRYGGLGLAYGAAGVLFALDVTGAGRFPEWEEWLLEHAAKPPHGTLLGLYDGLHGTAFALEHLGHRDAAVSALDACMSDDWQSLDLSLFGGLAGIGLNLAHFTDRLGEPRLAEALDRAAELVAGRLGDVDSVPETSGPPHPYAGLMRGSSGPAVFLVRMFDRTGDPAWLDRAAVALRQDLRRSRVREDSGAMEVDEGWRTMPYLATGSVGVGFALDEYLARRPDDEQFVEASRAIRRAARSRMYVQPGLFAGRGGILLYLAGRPPTAQRDTDVAAQIDRLAWHALPFEDGIAFPGDQLLRLSMDVATGTAGVLLALGAALHDAPVHLPLLASTAGAPAAPPLVPVPSGRGLVSLRS